ncbi:MAG: sulfatase-like hydrolase/transferase [Armatimonadota bacterium]|jgi:arylsulfatase A-like enzyme
MPDKPNVLVLFTDQQRWDTVGAYGVNPMDLTPNTDAMARRGTLFENAFTCQPVCAPARGSIHTGRHGTAHTVWRNGLVLPQSEQTTARQFKREGYTVGYIGKWHLSGTKTEPVTAELRGGFDDHWLGADLLEFTSHPYDTVMFDADNERVKLPGYRVDALTDETIKFLQERGADPFFLFVSWLEPHHQNDMNRYVAPDGYAARYDNPYVPPDLQGVPGDWYRELPSYYGIVKRLDECFGRILASLEELGLDDSTIVLFTSDHGSHFRTRNSEYKRSCHEACTRIPMIAQGPGFDRGLVVPELVSLVDVAPTLLDAAGVPVPEAMQGRSTMPLLDRATDGWPEEAFMQISEAIVGRAIRTERWKYCVYAPDRRGGADSCSDEYVEYQMYDLFADPHERVNLVGRGDYREVADELGERLKHRMVEAGEKEPAIRPARYYA